MAAESIEHRPTAGAEEKVEQSLAPGRATEQKPRRVEPRLNTEQSPRDALQIPWALGELSEFSAEQAPVCANTF